MCKNVKRELNNNEYDALNLFVYNVGCETFKSSSVLAAVNANKSSAAIVKEFSNYIWSKGKVYLCFFNYFFQIYQTAAELRAYEASLFVSKE